MKPKGITRRDFLRDGTSAALAGAFYLSLPGKLSARSGEKTRVVLIREQKVLNDKNVPDDAVLTRMLDDAVTTLLGEKDPSDAWKRLIKPDDIVGIKTNIWSYLPVPPGLEQAIHNRVIDAGVAKKNISMRDRGLLADNIFKRATALINVRPMRTHYWSGVGTLIKNYITFVNDPPSYHPDTCADLATIWNLPLVKGKTRLNILVMLTPLFQGSGPHHYNPIPGLIMACWWAPIRWPSMRPGCASSRRSAGSSSAKTARWTRRRNISCWRTPATAWVRPTPKKSSLSSSAGRKTS